jgi:NADH:ubiquinone oxidoreductase subunit E
LFTIVICVGSSCHVRGSDEVAATLERLIEQEGLSEQVELIGTFCMDHCSMGVSVRVGERVFQLRPEEAEPFFYREVLPRLHQQAS